MSEVGVPPPPPMLSPPGPVTSVPSPRHRCLPKPPATPPSPTHGREGQADLGGAVCHAAVPGTRRSRPRPHATRPVPPRLPGPPPTPGRGWRPRGAQGFPRGRIFWISPGIAEVPPGAWPRAARPGADRFFQPFGDIWQLLKEAAAPAAFHPPPRALRCAQTPPHLLPGLRRGWGPPGGPSWALVGRVRGPFSCRRWWGEKAGSDPNRGWQNPKTPGRAPGLFLGLHIPS